jgi:hypothetical protein
VHSVCILLSAILDSAMCYAQGYLITNMVTACSHLALQTQLRFALTRLQLLTTQLFSEEAAPDGVLLDCSSQATPCHHICAVLLEELVVGFQVQRVERDKLV